jgi:hypothetical protein
MTSDGKTRETFNIGGRPLKGLMLNPEFRKRCEAMWEEFRQGLMLAKYPGDLVNGLFAAETSLLANLPDPFWKVIMELSKSVIQHETARGEDPEYLKAHVEFLNALDAFRTYSLKHCQFLESNDESWVIPPSTAKPPDKPV